MGRVQWRWTHDVNPRPSIGIIPAIHSFEADQDYDCKDGNDTSPPDAKDGATDALSLAHFKPPYGLEKLAVYDDAHDSAVGGKEKIIESHGCLGSVGVSVGILGFDGWGVEKRGGGDGVTGEAQDV